MGLAEKNAQAAHQEDQTIQFLGTATKTQRSLDGVGIQLPPCQYHCKGEIAR